MLATLNNFKLVKPFVRESRGAGAVSSPVLMDFAYSNLLTLPSFLG